MPITEQQRADRVHFVGSSDQSILWGMTPDRTAYDLWLEKTQPTAPWDGNDSTRLGNALEPVLLSMLSEQFDVGSMDVNVHRKHPKRPYMAANLDALTTVGGKVATVEAKTSFMGFTAPYEYGDAGTCEVPARVLVQTHHAFACVPEAELCIVPALVAFKGFCVYVVERDPELVGECEEEAHKFWKFVEAKRPPKNCMPSLATLARVRRIPQKVVSVHPELVQAWQLARESRLAAEKAMEPLAAAEEQAKAAMVNALGTAEAGDYGDGEHILTYFETKRKGYTVKETTYRQVKLAKRKDR